MQYLVSPGHFSSGQGFQVRSGWFEQDRSRGSGHVRIVLVRSGQSSLLSLRRSVQVKFAWSGQVSICQFGSGQFRLVRSG